jgi:outer membrane protein
MRIRTGAPLALGAALLLLAPAVPAGAADTPASAGARFGWIDAQQVLDETEAGKAIKQRVEAFRDSRQKVIDLEEAELKKAEENLGQQMSLLSDDARREKQLEFQRKLGDYQKKVVELNRELQDKKDELLGEFNEVLLRAVRQVAEKEGYDYVLDYGGDGSVLYGSPDHDLTQRVMAQVDAGP